MAFWGSEVQSHTFTITDEITGTEYSVVDLVKSFQQKVEILQDDVDRLTRENMDYAKDLYQLERSIDERIDILVGDLTQFNTYEGQESSKENYQEGKEAP